MEILSSGGSKLELASAGTGEHVTTHMAGPHSEFLIHQVPGSLRICISNNFPGDVDGLGTSLEEPVY